MTTTFTASSHTAAFSRHEDFDGSIIVCHDDPECLYLLDDGDPVPGLLPTDRWCDCQFCIGGHKYVAISRTVLRYAGDEAAARVRREPARSLDRAPQPVAAMSDADVAEFLLGLGRKVEVDEVTGPMALAAERWLAAYTGDFEFLLDVRRKATRGLSNGQAKGVLNCWRADLVRSASRPAAVRETSVSETSQAPTPDVPAGHYATTSRTGNNDLDFWRIDRPTDGRWAGYTFVKRVIGGRADESVRGGEAKLALAAIAAAGPADAGRLYGQTIGRCCLCNRHLTDEASRAAGIGPDCATRA